jgi:hypothetical protein
MTGPRKNTPRQNDVCPIDDLFANLQKFDDEIGPGLNKHDRAAALIGVCLTAAPMTRGHIIGVLHHFDFDRGHIALTLDEHCGVYETNVMWRLDADGRYRLLA